MGKEAWFDNVWWARREGDREVTATSGRGAGTERDGVRQAGRHRVHRAGKDGRHAVVEVLLLAVPPF